MTASEANKNNYTSAENGTVYWTISFYIPSDAVSAALGLNTDPNKTKRTVTPDHWRKLILNHRCSLVLGEAIDPLFNDIADRDIQGNAQEFLISALEDPSSTAQSNYTSDNEIAKARDAVLEDREISFSPPESVSWITEGHKYTTTPPELNKPRPMTLKRFWFAHYGGALSYHLSFCYRYSERPQSTAGAQPPLFDEYGPATYYFLSMLQKLVAPKEFQLTLNKRLDLMRAGSLTQSIFDPETSIDLLDQPIVTGLSPKKPGLTRFWEGIEDRFEEDAQKLFQLAETTFPNDFRITRERGDWREILLTDQPVIEVPGLGMPRCRFMFFFHDKRFFERLMSANRRTSAQDGRYQPYLDKLKELPGKPAGPFKLDYNYWQWVAHEKNTDDCLDSLFLSGFNQNIIDFMNQDASEILDSTDPLYPDIDDPAEERFFVRFANHRALTTYVPASRSLEIGNDYIGTCPYAFLIHVLAIHNEYLDRLHEEATTRRLKSIEEDVEKIEFGIEELNSGLNINTRTTSRWLRNAEKSQEKQKEKNVETLSKRLNNVESLINKTKLAHYQEYLRYRYPNPFRYDTEHAVFEKLEIIRGTNRKQHTLQAALTNIEDQASDLSRQSRELALSIEKERQDKESRQRDQINTGLAALGCFGLIQVLYGLIQVRLQYGSLGTNDTRDSLILKLLPGRELALYAEAIVAGFSAALTGFFILWFIKTNPKWGLSIAIVAAIAALLFTL